MSHGCQNKLIAALYKFNFGKKFSLIKADVTDNSINDKALLTAFNLFGPPAILFFDKKGRHLKQFDVIGFKNAEEFNMLLEKIIDYEH